MLFPITGFGQFTDSWKVDSIPDQLLSSRINKLLALSDSLDTFFTLSPPYSEYLYVYRSDQENQKETIKIHRYKNDSLQYFTQFPEDILEGLDENYRIPEPINRIYDSQKKKRKKEEKQDYHKYQQFLNLNKQLPKNGIWYQNSNPSPNSLPNTYSILIKKTNKHVDFIIVSVNNKYSIQFSDTKENSPPTIIRKWYGYFEGFW